MRILDVNNDGFMDVVIGNATKRLTRIWSPDQHKWIECEFPVELVHVDAAGNRSDAGVRFGVWQSNGQASFLVTQRGY